MVMTQKFPQKRLSSIVLLLLSLSFSFCAQAEVELSGLYSGILYSSSHLETRATGQPKGTQNWGHIKVKVGTILNDLVSVEGQLGVTTNTNADLGTLTYGGYLRAGKDFSQYKLYGLLGYSGFHSYKKGQDSVNENSFSYGVGLEVFGSKNIAITLEYLMLVDKTVDRSDLTFDTLGLGFTYYFIEDKSYFNKNRTKIRSIRY